MWVSAHTNVVEETIVHAQACWKKSVHTESCAEHDGREDVANGMQGGETITTSQTTRKNETTMKLKFIPLAFLSVALVACGGGGGGGGGNTASVPTPAQANTAFVLSAKLNGTPVADFAVNAGEGKVLGMLTGEEVELTASAPYTLIKKSYGRATPDVRADTATTFRAAFNSVENTTASLVFAMNSDPTKVATVTLTIRGTSPNFDAVTPSVGDAYTYAENDKTLAGAAVPFPDITRVVTSLNAGGAGWNEDYIDRTRNVVLTKVNLNAQGNRTAYQATANDPSGCKDARYEPAEQLLIFPLQVGTPYRANWVARCLPSDSQNEDLTASVIAYEKVTTRGGVFNALRINQITRVTNSTNTGLPNRSYEQNVTVWFDPILGRNVKYVGVRTYPGGDPANRAAFLSETNIELINTVKN